MAVEFRLPDVGEGIHEAEIVRWLVHEGDRVEEFDPMVEVQTDKAIVELPAPASGVITHIHAPTGSIAHVGDVLVEIEPESVIGDPVVVRAPDPSPLAAARGGLSGPAPADAAGADKGRQREHRAVDDGVRTVETTPSQRRQGHAAGHNLDSAAAGRADTAGGSAGGPEAGARRPKATPGVRHFARQHGVSLWDVKGTGPGGRILKSDVERYLQERTAPTTSGPAKSMSEHGTSLLWSLAQRPVRGERDLRQGGYPTPVPRSARHGFAVEDGPYSPSRPARADSSPAGEGDDAVRRPLGAASRAATGDARTPTRVPFRGIRRATAEHVKRSVFTAPHVTAFDECDATALVALRQRWNERLESEGRRISYLPFIVKAVVSALRAFPYFNARLDEEAEEILLLPEYHIGIAVDTPDGLFVPVVRDADQLTLREIGEEIYRLSTGARNRTLTPQDLRGSTFTITNMGPIGGLFATPILNYPEVGILGIHQIQKKPVVIEDEIRIRQVMTVTLSFDHRVIDGAMSVRFLNHLKRLIEHPEELMLELR
ncbi:dihydrolipoamide acetyltransferase family protein [Alicyclobacillus shizuokensis]|uniref:dihydrolipoamide acetyltransferase family protein n=1 Tax=Alicyclobacillus shizuokensis TaxID=392014 RepID=UPI00083629A1|nr:dihydrolipoamide acetyltransferase family protein [Alicyclobacillus shizuokensis]MCL6626690.1 2-oxo acid dehydrogenase subunit E2 [Alicyclobacillus shizuokensis]